MNWLWKVVEMSYSGQFVVKRCQHIADSWRHKTSLNVDSSRKKIIWNILAFLAFDLALGFVALTFVSALYEARLDEQRGRENSGDKVIEGWVLGATDSIVFYLRRLLKWVMGAPAGLKLNSVLSQSLGKFFLYHIHLWRTFLLISTPYVSQLIDAGLRARALAFIGISLQICLVQDALNVVTFHIHCFYAYARRLFLNQSSGLRSLWRLFRGKKYNPLRDRVDSLHPNSDVEQLFVGTVGFTILLFLYPTTLVFYVIFGSLECCVIGLHGALGSMVAAMTFLADNCFGLKKTTEVNCMSCWRQKTES